MRKKIIIISVIFVFILTELYLRHVYSGMLDLSNIVKKSDDAILGYELNPGIKVKFNGFKYRIPESLIEVSDQGLRDRKYALQKDYHVRRISFIGDSYVFGWGLNLQNTIPKQLENLLNSNSAIKYEVMNCGIIGYNLIQEVELLKKKVSKFNPDIIIFFISDNDICPKVEMPSNFSNRAINFLYKHSFIFRVSYVAVVGYYNNRDLSTYELNKFAIDTFSSFERINDIKGKDTKVLIVIKEPARWLSGLFQECKKYNFYVLDLSTLLESYGDKVFLTKEEQHYNEKGCGIIAKKIFSFLKNANLKIKN